MINPTKKKIKVRIGKPKVSPKKGQKRTILHPRPKLLGKKLQIIREHFGLIQLEMLKLVCPWFEHHESGGIISLYENDEREPPLAAILNYARVSGVSVETLIDDNLDLNVKDLPLRHK